MLLCTQIMRTTGCGQTKKHKRWRLFSMCPWCFNLQLVVRRPQPSFPHDSRYNFHIYLYSLFIRRWSYSFGHNFFPSENLVLYSPCFTTRPSSSNKFHSLSSSFYLLSCYRWSCCWNYKTVTALKERYTGPNDTIRCFIPHACPLSRSQWISFVPSSQGVLSARGSHPARWACRVPASFFQLHWRVMEVDMVWDPKPMCGPDFPHFLFSSIGVFIWYVSVLLYSFPFSGGIWISSIISTPEVLHLLLWRSSDPFLFYVHIYFFYSVFLN